MKNLDFRRNEINSKGITLVALVITVIILLILAGVAVATLTGDNGLLQKANVAKNTSIESEGLERIQLAVMASYDNRDINTTSLAKNLSQINGLTDTNNQAITENTEIKLPKSVKLNNVKYKVKEDGTVEKSLLSLEYQEIEYIESTGTQYINTNYFPDENTNAKYKVCVLEYKSEGPHLLSSSNFYFPFYRNRENCLLAYRNNNASLKIKNLVFSVGDIYEYDAFWNGNIVVNGNVIAQLINVGSKDTTSLYIGTYGGSPNNSAYTLKGRIYYCKIYNGNVIKRNYIPCYTTTSVTNSEGNPVPANTKGLYDLVEGKFYTNANTATNAVDFEAGPVV